MLEQQGFFFDAALTETPASQLPPPKPVDPKTGELLRLSGPELIGVLQAHARSLEDDVSYDDLLAAAGFSKHSITAWHCARAFDALLYPNGEFQAYQPETGGVRFRRLPPHMPCPG